VECTGDYSEKLDLDWVDSTKSLPTEFLVIHPPMLVDCMIMLDNIATKQKVLRSGSKSVAIAVALGMLCTLTNLINLG